MTTNKVARIAGIVASVASVASLTAFGLVAIAQAQAPGAIQDRHHRGLLRRLCRHQPRPGRGHADGGRRFRRQGARPSDRGRLGRPPEQARRRRHRSRASGTTDGVKMITGIDTSSVALAVRKIARTRAGSSSTSARPRPTSPARPARRPARLGLRHLPLADVTGSAIVQAGRRQLVLPHRRLRLRPGAGARRLGRRQGGRRQGGGLRPHPLTTQDFSSFLLQAQASKAKIDRPCECRQDTINSIKQAGEFGIVQGRPDVSPGCWSSHRREVARPARRPGPRPHRGLLLGPERRDPRLDQALPRQAATSHPLPATAGAYSSTLHYLKAVQAAGTDEAKAVMAKMQRDAGQRRHDQERQAARGRPR